MTYGNWKSQLANRIETVAQLKQYINLSREEEEEIERIQKKYRWGITPYYASLMDKKDRACPIRLQAVPSIKEFQNIFNIESLPSFHKSAVGSENPLWKEGKTDVKCIIWRYPDRIVFHTTNLCATYCRHCSRKVKKEHSTAEITDQLIAQAVDFISKHPAIRDVLLSGGDPLTMEDNLLERIISRLRNIKHLQIIRIGTRVLCTLPQRITPGLCNMLRKYHPIWINTQFNHPKEITKEVERACDRLLDAGIPLGNQSVLLKGVNDDPDTMKKLVQELVRIRVRPYYLYHADLVRGTEHFRTSIDKGMEIMEHLRGHITGFAVPTYVICTPLGKTPLQPQYVVGKGEGYIVLRNYEWRVWKDPDL